MTYYFVDYRLAIVITCTLTMPLTLGTNEVKEVCIASESAGLASLCSRFMLGSLAKICSVEVLHERDVMYIRDKAGLSYTSLYPTDDRCNHGLVIT